jgi:hypothetical protein
VTLWHLTFPLARQRHYPSLAAYDTPAAAERSDTSARSALAILALFGPDPKGREFSDRALAGWCPGGLVYAEVELRQWLRDETAAEGQVA